MSNMKKNKLVLIKWLDSKGGSSEWEFLDEIANLKPVVCYSVGFLIDDKKTYKTLAPTMGGGQIWGRITIPSCSIVKFKVLAD
jgi:hypothetical protein